MSEVFWRCLEVVGGVQRCWEVCWRCLEVFKGVQKIAEVFGGVQRCVRGVLEW